MGHSVKYLIGKPSLPVYLDSRFLIDDSGGELDRGWWTLSRKGFLRLGAQAKLPFLGLGKEGVM
jgi:hypothetical protein